MFIASFLDLFRAERDHNKEGLSAPCLQLNLFALLLFLVGLGWLAGVSVWQLVNSQLFVLYYVHYADRSFISRMIIAIFHTGRLMRGFTGKLGGFMQHNFFRPFLKVFGGWEHDYAHPVYLPSSDSTHGQENDLSQVLSFYLLMIISHHYNFCLIATLFQCKVVQFELRLT